ncbi:MAG TPA: Mfa1 family fimbria major subunit, partial [Dysgonamonadaceae bacterium]|nr:Mfa1 family fimbria major subunit [Dysgonamonadaceae bacterium]
MKKITRLLLLAAISIGMVACSNDDVPQTPESLRGTTYASIAVTLPKAPSTRTLPDDYNKLPDWEGIDAIKTITVFLVNETLGTIDHSTFGTSQFESIDNGVLKPNLAVKGTPGEAVKAYVVLNGNGDVLTTLKGTTPGAFAGVYATAVAKNARDLASNDGTNDVIMMTNTVLPTAIEILPNVSEEDAKAGNKNSVKVKVERVVSRAIATVAAAAKSTVIPVKDAMDVKQSEITIQSVSYVVGQSNKEFFLTKKTDWTTPAAVYGHVPSVDTWNPALFDNTGLAKSIAMKEATGAAALVDFNTALTTELADSKFVLPVTHEDDKYEKGNTTFFEVIAIFTPDLVDGA